MIGFLHPWALAGLAAAAIPVLLHLLARREPPTVVFPAVRYLITTTREHQRRLKLQHLLLLLFRTLLIIALVLAAAGPTLPRSGVAGHAPSALVLVVDNSPSSGVVVSGTARLAQLQAAARRVLARATPDDALWLLTADGLPRRGDRQALLDQVAALPVSPRRLDLGRRARRGRGGPRRRVASGRDRAAHRPPGHRRLPGRPSRAARGGSAGRAAARQRRDRTARDRPAAMGRRRRAAHGVLVGDSGGGTPVSARLGTRPARQALAHVGGAAVLAIPGVSSGWWNADAELDPDELRIDDRRVGVVRVAPVARVNWDAASRYVAAACEVLEANRRIGRGSEVTLGRLAPGSSIVQPPEDGAAIGALNRALAARGVAWRYGAPVLEPAMTDSGPLVGRVRVLRRYQLSRSRAGAPACSPPRAALPGWCGRGTSCCSEPARPRVDRPAGLGGVHAVHGRAGEPDRARRSVPRRRRAR